MKKENKNKRFETLLIYIENTISNYDKELKYTVNNDEHVGYGSIIFNSEASELISKNRESYEIFIRTLDVKFTNIVIVESTPNKLHYKLKNKGINNGKK